MYTEESAMSKIGNNNINNKRYIDMQNKRKETETECRKFCKEGYEDRIEMMVRFRPMNLCIEIKIGLACRVFDRLRKM